MSDILSNEELFFDIVVCVGPKDNNIVNSMISFTKKNILGYRNIYLVCSNPSISIEGTITIDEKIFPFNINDISSRFGKTERNGWYLQQLLKLYSGNVIPGILKRYLVIDCDTHFLVPTPFITRDGKHALTTGTEFHKPYFKHMNRLHNSLNKIHPLSGISHHTFFHTDLVNELFKIVETYHNNGKHFWEIFLDVIDKKEFLGSGASEYEIYLTYVYLYHPNKINIRQLNWKNVNNLSSNLNKNYHYVSVHWHMRI